MTDPRQRLLAQWMPVMIWSTPLRQSPFVFVEPADVLPGPSILMLGVVAELHVAPHRHEVMQIVRQQVEPLAVPALVEQVASS